MSSYEDTERVKKILFWGFLSWVVFNHFIRAMVTISVARSSDAGISPGMFLVNMQQIFFQPVNAWRLHLGNGLLSVADYLPDSAHETVRTTLVFLRMILGLHP